MTGLLSIATSALTSFQRALTVTANNVANAHTPGYSRQAAMFAPNGSQRVGGSFSGSGVTVSNIQRYSDMFSNQQVRTAFSSKSQYDAFFQQAYQVGTLLSQDGTSVSTAVQQFYTAMGQLNDAPESMSSRGVVMNQSQRLVDQFNIMQKRLDEYQENTTQQITEAVNIINQLTTNIAALNRSIANGDPSPDMLDGRDQLLRELSEYVEISTVISPNGTVDVTISGGESLVVGGVQRGLVVGPQKDYQSGTTILLNNGAGNVDMTSKFTTGMIGGLKDYETNILSKASQTIGQMAMGIAQNFNAQHKLGVDLNNQIGKDFFKDFNAVDKQLNRASASPTNVGTGIFSVAITDVNQTQISDYDVIITDNASKELRITRQSDGTSSVLTWTDNPPAPPAGQVVIDGMTITVDNIANLANNDHYTLSPTRGAARDLALNISDARELAFASPVRTQAVSTNTGTASVGLGNVLNTNGVNKDYRIDFISPTQFNIINVTDGTLAGPLTFTPNTENTIELPDSLNPSYSIVISGIPNTGDQFTSGFNIGGMGDNRNGLKLLGLQQAKIFSGSTESAFDKYSSLIAHVGGKTNQARLAGEASNILFQQAEAVREGTSGVILDEEAANMVSFQQAYHAAGRLMTVATEMMDVLFDAMR